MDDQQTYSPEEMYQIAQQSQTAPARKESNLPNPFEMEQYKNLGISDVPITYGNNLAESLLNDNEVPEEIRKKYWYIFHKDNTLTFLDDERKKSKLLNFDIMTIDMKHCMDYYDYTFEEELRFGILRNIFETKLDRSLGIKGSDTLNERKALQSQFQEMHQISDSGNSTIREGFFKRLLGRR